MVYVYYSENQIELMNWWICVCGSATPYIAYSMGKIIPNCNNQVLDLQVQNDTKEILIQVGQL